MQSASNDIKRGSEGVAAWRRVLALAVSIAVVGAAVAGAVAFGARLIAVLRSSAPARPEQVLTPLVAAAALLLVAWLALGTLVTVARMPRRPSPAGAAAAGSAPRPPSWAPALSGRFAALLLGVSLTSGLASSVAVAVPVPGAGGERAASVERVIEVGAGWSPTVEPGWRPLTPEPPASASPDRPSPAPAPGWAPTSPPHTEPVAPDLLGRHHRTRADDVTVVVVRRGDTLWAIAARHLGDGATTSEIAREWPRWYAANRDRIGDDPDLIHPGLELHVPGPEQQESR